MLHSDAIPFIYDNFIDYLQDDKKTHKLSLKIYNYLNKLKSPITINAIDYYDDSTFSVRYTYKNNMNKYANWLILKDLQFKNI